MQTASVTSALTFITAALDLESSRKNIIWMLKALNKITHYRLKIILVGKYGNQIQQLVRESMHNYILPGELDRNNALAYYRQADVFLFASKADDWGYVLTEAMSMGLCIIAPRDYPFDFIINNEKLLYKRSDENDFIKKVVTLYENEYEVSHLRKELFERAKDFFGREQFADKINTLIG